MFIVELWDSIFTPGTTPALIAATHGSFILLLLSLALLIYMTKSIHYINLLIISIILYGLVIWFIGELQQAKLQSNAELEAKKEDENKDNNDLDLKPAATNSDSVNTASVDSTIKKRKV